MDTASSSFLPVSMWSLPLCAEAVQSALRSSSGRTSLYAGVDSVCQWEEVGSGSSYAAILGVSLFFVVVRGILILFISENVTEINILTHMD